MNLGRPIVITMHASRRIVQHLLIVLNSETVANHFSVHLRERCLLVEHTHISEDWHVEVGWERYSPGFREKLEPER